MTTQNNSLSKNLLYVLLIMILILGIFPASAITKGASTPVTKDVSALVTDAVLDGVLVDDEGKYHVQVNRPYNINFTFKEKSGSLEMDMSDYIYFALPEGIVTTPDTASGEIEIGVYENGTYRQIFHNYSIENNIMTITWNNQSPYFNLLKNAHNIEFSFGMQAQFDGSAGTIKFGDGGAVEIKVDNTGSVTITKDITGLKSDVTLTDAQKQAMTFELQDSNGEAVKTFTYADMVDGVWSCTGLEPGDYTVVETGHPDFANYTFDTVDSVTTNEGTLPRSGLLNLALKNDYEYDKGNLELNKTVSFTNADNTDTAPANAAENITFNVTGPYDYNETFTYASFNDGKLTLTGLNVGEYTVTETNNITGYTWTYKVNNEAPEQPAEHPSAKAQVTKGNTATASFENNYVQKTANLKIKKIATGLAAGASVPADTKFTVTFPNGETKTIYYSQLNANGEYVFENVPLGTYSIAEEQGTAAVANHTLKVSVTGSGKVELSTENQTKTATITNTYSPYGSLKVAKTIGNSDLSVDDLTPEQKAAIVFDVYNSANKKVGSMTYADILAGNDTITKLPVGTYRIEETAPEIQGYTLKTVPEDKKQSVTVTTGELVTGSFTNTYTRDAYNITVNKMFGDDSSYNAANLPNNIKENTVFTIKKGSKVIASCNYTELSDKLNNLALDDKGPYSITETNPTIPGLAIQTEISLNGKAFTSGNSMTVTLRNHEPDTLTFKNSYTIQGRITVSKTVEGLYEDDEKDLREKIRYSIYRVDGETTTLFAENKTLADLAYGIIVPQGTYFVQETDGLGVDGYNGPEITTQVTTETGSGPVKDKTDTTSSPSRSYNFTVGQNETVNVSYINEYVSGIGSGKVSLIKYVSGLDGIDTDEIQLKEDSGIENEDGQNIYNTITFKIERYKEVSEGVFEWEDYHTFKLKDLLEGNVNLRPGKYRVTEQGGEIAGYDLNVDFLFYSNVENIEHFEDVDPDGRAYNKIEFEVLTNQTLKLEAHNVYSKLGNLKITKTVTGDLVTKYKSYLTTSRTKVKFHVEGPFNFEDDFTFDDIAATNANYGEKVYTNIPVGNYTVTETAENTDNYIVTQRVAPAEGTQTTADGKYIVATGGTAQVNFTNEYNHKKGNLKITKTMAGEVPAFTEDQKKAMEFNLKNSSGTLIQTITYNDFDADGTYTFTDLDTGSYKVTETIYDALKNYNINISGDYNKNVSVTYGATGNAKITNTFTQLGTLKLTKTFSGASISQDEKDSLQFEYYQVDDAGKIIGTKKTVNYSQFTNGSYSVKVAHGNYVVNEVNTDTGYIRTTTVKVDDNEAEDGRTAETEITFGGTSTVAFNNDYTEVASLKITKSFSGLDASKLTEAQKKAIVFTVTDSDNQPVGEPFSLYEMTDGTRTKIIKNLSTGTYYVTETINDPDESLFGKYTYTTKNKVGSATAVNGTTATVTANHGENTVTFTNTYTEIQPLKVVKSSSSTYVGQVEKNGLKYPVWRFTLAISNLNTLTTRNGTTTFTDVFDKDNANWFRLATADEVKGIDAKGNAYITSKVTGKSAPDAAFNETDNSIVISNINAETADKCDFTYYLVIKDKDALTAISTPDETGTSSGLSHNFNNVVTYHPLPNDTKTATTSKTYKYEFNAISKSLDNVDEDGFLYEIDEQGKKSTVNYADYTIKLNENGVSIGESTTVTAIDRFSDNQTVLASSIKTVPEDGVGVYVSNTDHTIEFTFPNATPVTITYRVNIINSKDAVVHLTNDVTFLGFFGGIGQDVNRTQGGEGHGSVYYLKLLKLNSLNNNVKLTGVYFDLYDGDTDELLTTGSTDNNGQLVIDSWGENNDESFMSDHNYYLVEKESLAGYNLSNEKIRFRFSDTETSGIDSTGINILNCGDELPVTNVPVTTALTVNKSFNNWNKQNSFTFKLEPVSAAPMPAPGGEYAIATKDNPTATFGAIHFTDGIGTYRYTIQEVVNSSDMVDGVTYDFTKYPVTVTVTDANNDGEKEIAVTYGENNSNSLTITNTYSEGDLKVTKTVNGNAADTDKEFEFTVTMASTGINGTYGNMTFVNGVATFKLTDGESKTATGLPNGVEYTVTEDDYTKDGYVTTKTGDEGTIVGNDTLTADFTNTRDAEGSLTIAKTLAGNDTDSDKDFTFNIELKDTSINGTFSNVVFTGGKATVTLKGGQSKTIEGLPNGTEYSVTEAEANADNYETTMTGNTGKISETAVSVAAFTNTRDSYGDLTVTKAVDGNAGNTTKEFSFTVTLKDTSINGTFGDMTFENGVATFKLKDSESLTAEGLPNATKYTVTEDDYTADGYVTTKTGDEGTIVGNDTLTASFTNTRNAKGSLTIAKTLAGNDTDSDKDFTFNIELKDTSINGTFSNVVFTGGKATVTLKGGESKTIEGLPNGAEYTVTEAEANADNYETTMTGNTGKISETAVSVASFTNTRNSYGDLTVTKKLAGNAPRLTDEFSFTVTLKDTSINGTFGDMTFENGVATFKLKDSESLTAEGLPNGTKYTVTEDDYTKDGYVTTKTGDEGTIVGNDTLTADFTNTRNAEGSLTIAKTLAGNDTDSDKDFTFNIELKDTSINGTFSNVVFTGGKATVTLKGGQSKTIEGLPNGTEYSVTEAEANADNYETTMTGNTGKISETAVSVASFTNTRNSYGDLTVTKAVKGNAGSTTKEFSFTVTLKDTSINGTYGDMTFVNGVATFTLKDSESISATDLPNGVEYTVTEDDYTKDGYVTTKTGDEGTIVGNDTLTADFTNTRDAEGSLTIAKTLAGNDTDSDKDFTFNIELKDTSINGTFSNVVFTGGKATVTLKGGQSKTIEGLPNGTEYSVTEAEANADNYETTMTGNTGKISETAVSVASFTNTRNSYGDLTVTKKLAGNAPRLTDEFSFTVTLEDTSINGTFGDMTFDNGVATFTLKGGQSISATDLPNGVEYTVTEDDYTADGYVTTKTGDEGTIVGDDTQTAVFTNTRDAEGSLTIAKTLEGNDTDSTKDFTFNIDLKDTSINGIYSEVEFTDGKATVILKGGESKTIDGLPNGTEYTVTEAEANADGYETTVSGDSGKISETAVSVAAFTNTRDSYGDLTVTKAVKGNAGSTTKEFSFTVTLEDTSIDGTYGDMTFVNGVATFTLKDSESISATDLPNGVEYTVTEDDYTKDGYVTTKTGDEGTIVGNDTLTADFTNTRNAEGSLTIAKTLAGNDTDSDKEFTFNIELKDASINGTFSEVEFTEGKATITLKGGESKTIDGLPNGTEYTVTEDDYTADGYESTVSGDIGTISETAASVAAFTNTRNTFGKLTVTKKLAGNAPDISKEFKFTVTLEDTSINGTYGDMTFENGVATFTLKGGQSITAEGLPNGTEFTVVENDYTADGYKTTKEGDEGFIVGDDELTATFTNTKNITPPSKDDNNTSKNSKNSGKSSQSPQTGDDSNLSLWFSLLALSSLGLICSGTAYRKKNHK